MLASNRCNDPFLSPQTIRADLLVTVSLSDNWKISIADAQRCLDGGRVKMHKGVTLIVVVSPFVQMIFHHVICPSGPQEKRC